MFFKPASHSATILGEHPILWREPNNFLRQLKFRANLQDQGRLSKRQIKFLSKARWHRQPLHPLYRNIPRGPISQPYSKYMQISSATTITSVINNIIPVYQLLVSDHLIDHQLSSVINMDHPFHHDLGPPSIHQNAGLSNLIPKA